MHYNIHEIPLSEFETMRGYVERAYKRVHRKPFDKVPIEIATSNMSDIPMSKRKAHHLDESYAGWAFRPENYIWVRPNRGLLDVRRTAIHEISHLQSDEDAHGPKWRKTFGIAWAMWLRKHEYSWAEVRTEIYQNVSRYRRYRKYTPQGHWNSYDSYRDRINKEVEETVRMARALCD